MQTSKYKQTILCKFKLEKDLMTEAVLQRLHISFVTGVLTWKNGNSNSTQPQLRQKRI